MQYLPLLRKTNVNKKNQKILLTNIQRFSLHDGPGIRTTIFLKGCSIRCPWCSNPENLKHCPEPYVKDDVPGIYGRYLTCDEVYHEIMKDKIFYQIGGTGKGLNALPGGVTFSGGEALLQITVLEPLLERLISEGIHLAVESSLFVSTDKLVAAMKYFNLFYVDMKILDKKRCRETEHGDLELYMENLDILFRSGLPIVVRVPVIGGYTDGEENRKEVVRLIRKYRPDKVELIKEHDLGMSKYVSLSMPVPEYRGVSDELVERYRMEIEKTGVTVQICRN